MSTPSPGPGRRSRSGKRARPASGEPKRGPLARRHPRQPLLWRVSGWIAVIAVVAVTGTALAAYFEARSLWDSIGKVAIGNLGKRPPAYTNSQNILVFGVDSRSGLTAAQQSHWHVGLNAGELNTDTVMLVHISPGRQHVTVLSFPRDIQVPYYSCPSDGPHRAGQQLNLSSTERINAVYAAGGMTCLWKTVEQVTGIRINHAIEVDFKAFVKVINDIGGVNVCAPAYVSDSVSGLRLKKGWNHLTGVQALKYWRTRENIGMGDDPQRIQRDQFLMASLLQGIKKSGLLGNPAKMLSVLGDVAKSIHIDNGMTEDDLVQVAQSLRGLSTGHVQFVTVPWVPDPYDPAALVDFAEPQARSVFAAIAHDRKLPKHIKAGATRRASGGTPETRTVSPAKVRVTVLNGTTTQGIAASTASSLTSRGFTVVGTPSNAPSATYVKSVIKYASAADLPAADTLKAQISHVTLKLDPQLTPGTLDLILGSTFTSLKPQSATSAGHHGTPGSAATAVDKLGKKLHGIKGNANVCKDTSAFTGPNGY